MMRSLSFLLSSVALASASIAGAQATRSIDSQSPSPEASIEQVAWLAGSWVGAADDGDAASEAWQGPLGGVMTGSFIQTIAGENGEPAVEWTEFMLIAPKDNSLVLYTADFLPGITDSSLYPYRLVAIEGCTVYFHEVTFQCEREGDEIIGLTTIWQVTDPTTGDAEEPLTYRYKRVR